MGLKNSNKKSIIQQIVGALDAQLFQNDLSAQAALEAATHAESRAEDSHDTRSIEAAYLAGAQGKRSEDLRKSILYFKNLEVRDFRPQSEITEGACVEISKISKNKNAAQTTSTFVFVCSAGRGLTLLLDSLVPPSQIQLVAPNSPLGEALLGQKAGDSIVVEAKNGTQEYEILSVL